MIEIYFDGVLLDSDYYAGISNEFKQFDDSFYLGATSANTFKIEVPTYAINNIPENVTIKMDSVLYATLIVDKYEIKDDGLLSLDLVDKMVNFNFNYDASSIVPCTIKDILEDICDKAGVELATSSFTNDNVLVNYYDSRKTAREYLEYIAELNGGYATIGEDGRLYLKKYNNIPVEIDLNDCESYIIGQHHKIERVIFDNGLLKYETSDDETLETLYLNANNVYINSEEVFNNIASQILNFEYYCMSISNCVINSSIKAGDIIVATDGENNYPMIAQYSLNYNGDWIGGYEFNVKSQKQQETQIISNEENIKNILVQLDRNENTLKTVVEDTKTIENKVEKTVKYIIQQYKIRGSSSDWSETYPERQPGETVLTRNKIVYVDDTFEYSPESQLTGDKGDTGNPGQQGPAGRDASISSTTEPSDTSQLWLDLNTNELKQYVVEQDGGHWIVVNDFSGEINNISDSISSLQDMKTQLESRINELNEVVTSIKTSSDTSFEQTSEQFEMRFTQITESITEVLGEIHTHIQEQEKFIRFKEGTITLGDINSSYSLKLENDKINLYYGDQSISEWFQDIFTARQIKIGTEDTGYFTFVPRPNGSLSFRKVVG